MKSPSEALAFLERQRKNGSGWWSLKCESLQRQAYGLPAHYRSAEIHGKAIPSKFRHGHEMPSKGDIAIFLNGGFGHIVTCTGVGWGCYTNDYKGRGKVWKISDLRDLAPWCGAHTWFIADAWWSDKNYLRTHISPVKDTTFEDDEEMAIIFRTHGDADKEGELKGGAAYLVIGDKAIQMGRGFTTQSVPEVNSPSEATDEAFYKAVTRYRL